MTRENAWPPVKYAKQIWKNNTSRAFGPAATKFTMQGETYSSAVPPLIANLHPIVSKDTDALVQEAETAMQRFDSTHGDKMSSFAPILLRSESAASSQIENLTASARQIFTAEIFATGKRNAAEIVANTNSMKRAIAQASDLSVDAIKNVHAELMKDQPRHTPGKFRTEAVWIGKNSFSPVNAIYVAPDYPLINELMQDLVIFSRRYDITPLIQAAITHAQFETIHPFSDGNGRTGRALIQAMLRNRRLTRNVAVPVSAGLLSNVAAYHDSLMDYRQGKIEHIIKMFSFAALKAVPNAEKLIAEIEETGKKSRTVIRPRRGSVKSKILDYALFKPVFTAESIATDLGVSVTNIYRDLNALRDQDFLAMKTEYNGPAIWRQPDVLASIDAFAARSGLRT